MDNGVRRALNILGVAAAVAAVPAAIFGSAWFAMTALGVAAASTVTRFALDAIKFECDAEAALCEACSDLGDVSDAPALALSQQPTQATDKQWAASVTSGRQSRHRTPTR